MNRFHVLLAALTVVTTLNIVMVFMLRSEQTEGGNRPHHRKAPRNAIIQKLHFDQEQVAKYDQLIEGHKSQINFLENEIYGAKEELFQNLTTNTTEERDSLVKSIGASQQEVETVHINHFLDIRALCTEQQLPYFDSLQVELAALFRHKRPRMR